jgi:dienelactone hydrolase
VYDDERLRFEWRDPAFAADHAFLRERFPDRDVLLASSTRDERRVLVSVTADVEPGEVWLFDRDTRKLARQYRLRERLPREHLAPMRHVRYPSSDGLEIPAYLTLPAGVRAKDLPLVVFPHGGPWARDSWRYHPYAQFLANRGYAVLQPNFRGSTGYGQRFLDAGNRQWGDLMQDDLTWGVKHLVAQGVVDPERVGIMGGSYGGYATLAGVTFTPDLYAAAVAIVAPSNLITLLETIPPYWEAGRIVFHTRMGDPTTPEGKAQLLRQSPLSHVEKIRTPLVVVQGANDPRVKKSESDQIVVALRDRGYPVVYLVAPDEGHGFARPVNNMAMMAKAEAFLARHLGGRFQEDTTPAVAARLAEITVDPATVTMPRRVSAAAGTPAVAAPLAPGTWRYAVAIQAGAQKLAMKVTTTVKPEGDAIAITEVAESPMGPSRDEARLDGRTLAVRARSGAQGPMKYEVAFAGGKATGAMTVGGAAQPIAAEVGGELFADGAGASQVLGALPLADGYETAVRNFDLGTGKAKVLSVKVEGKEQVTVPAGTFTAWKVRLEDPDGGGERRVWIDAASRQVVRTWARSPAMGGAELTSELSK